MTSKRKKIGVVGIYGRKFLFFVFLFAIFSLSWAYIYYNRYQADEITNPVATNYSDETKIKVSVKSNGEIFIDGKDSGKKTTALSDGDEIRIPIIDNPGKYVDSLNIELSLPKDVANSSQYEVLAIHGVESSNANVANDSTILYTASGVSPYATVSIVAKLPKGTIERPISVNIFSEVSSLKFDYWLVLAITLPFVSIIYMIFFLAYQSRMHKIDYPDKAVSSPPMAIPPAIVGVLYHQRVGPRELAATLIDLARRKDITILDRDRGFAFGKGKFDQQLLGYEKLLLSKIFRDNLSSDRIEIEKRISNHMYSKKMSVVSAGVYAIATRLGYFKVNPRSVHAKYRLLGILIFIIGLAGLAGSLLLPAVPKFTALLWVGMMVSATIITFSASNIPLRTEIGKEVLSNWLAFRKFLSDPTPIKYSPTVSNIFEAYLPYAIVLDCEGAWARRFEQHNFTIPEWFLTDKPGLGIEDFCLTLFPIVSYVGRSFAALREPGFE